MNVHLSPTAYWNGTHRKLLAGIWLDLSRVPSVGEEFVIEMSLGARSRNVVFHVQRITTLWNNSTPEAPGSIVYKVLLYTNTEFDELEGWEFPKYPEREE